MKGLIQAGVADPGRREKRDEGVASTAQAFGFVASVLLLLACQACRGAVVWQRRELTLQARRGVDASVHGIFVFTNTGKKPVTIGEITTGCGCTDLVPENGVVGPGQQGRLWAVFTVSGRRGLQVKTLTVATDDPASALTELTLKVDILEGKPDGPPTASR